MPDYLVRSRDHLVGLVVKASASRAAGPGFDSCFIRGDFPLSRNTSDLNIGIPAAAMPDTWRYRVSAVHCDRVR